MKNISVDAARLEQSIREMGALGFGSATKGRTRLALSDEDQQGRDLFRRWLREANLEIRVDAMGNIFGLRQGIDAKALPIMMGSHLDTVKDAGMFDGIVGVLGGLEVVRTLNDENIKTERPIVVANFTNEEGARFQFDMMGSNFYCGVKTAEQLYAVTDDAGLDVGAELARIGYKGTESVPVGYYFELHIEQGPVLDAENLQIGVVEGIQGLSWWQGEFIGEANHAGSTPMHLRHDAVTGVAELALEIEKLTARLGNASVGTMGRLKPEPDIINVVPGRCSFTIDFRQFNPGLFEKGKKEVARLAESCAERRGLSYKLQKLADANPVVFDNSMVELVAESAAKLGLSAKTLYSGASHDAQFLAAICPTAMIFVPSAGGRSHCPEENTEFADITNGCNVLLQSVLKLAIIEDCQLDSASVDWNRATLDNLRYQK